MNIGLVCSAGGSAALAACEIVIRAGVIERDNISVVVDRECGAASLFREHGIDVHHIAFDQQDSFSGKVASHFMECSVNVVFLFYSRLISESLYAALPTINIHPSFLPAFPGFKALEQAKASGTCFLGATAHFVDAGMDTGRILVQASLPFPVWADITWMNRISYIQKALVATVCVDLLASGVLQLNHSRQENIWNLPPSASLSVNPTFANCDTAAEFCAFLHENNCEPMNIAPINSGIFNRNS